MDKEPRKKGSQDRELEVEQILLVSFPPGLLRNPPELFRVFSAFRGQTL
jgi:hypothetical protein